MLDGEPHRPLGAMPPLWRQATLEKLAVNAVMAGCEPPHFPIILAAVEAMLDPAFNLYGVQATTHSVAPLVVVHGRTGARWASTRAVAASDRAFVPTRRSGGPIRLDPAERRRGVAGPTRHGHPGKSGEVLVLRRRERRGLPVGTSPRRRCRHRVWRRAPAQRERPCVDHRVGHPHHRGRHRGLPRLERRVVHVAEPAHADPRSRARGDGRRRWASRGATSSSFSSSTPGCPCACSSSAGCGGCTTGPPGCRRRAMRLRSCPRCPPPETSSCSWPAAPASTPPWCPTARSAAP